MKTLQPQNFSFCLMMASRQRRLPEDVWWEWPNAWTSQPPDLTMWGGPQNFRQGVQARSNHHSQETGSLPFKIPATPRVWLTRWTEFPHIDEDFGCSGGRVQVTMPPRPSTRLLVRRTHSTVTNKDSDESGKPCAESAVWARGRSRLRQNQSGGWPAVWSSSKGRTFQGPFGATIGPRWTCHCYGLLLKTIDDAPW